MWCGVEGMFEGAERRRDDRGGEERRGECNKEGRKKRRKERERMVGN